MSQKNDRVVFRRTDGVWVNKLASADRASSLHNTQADANKAAADMLRNQGGGERTTMGIHGHIVSKDTIAGNDPRSVRDTEH
jgi:hypothetical protein